MEKEARFVGEFTRFVEELYGLEGALKEIFLSGNGGTLGCPGVTVVDDLFIALGDVFGSTVGSGDFRNLSFTV